MLTQIERGANVVNQAHLNSRILIPYRIPSRFISSQAPIGCSGGHASMDFKVQTIDQLKITKTHMNNHIKFKIQNPTHLTTPLEIQCGF